MRLLVQVGAHPGKGTRQVMRCLALGQGRQDLGRQAARNIAKGTPLTWDLIEGRNI